MIKKISKCIFREYDIRGIINETLFENTAYLIGRGFCSLNKNINTTNFNAFLTLFITFAILKAFPPALSWMVLDANISGDTKEACTGTGACWTYIKVWFKRFMYGMYPNELH